MAKDTPRTFSTAEACRIVGFDAAKLNEMIHNESYPLETLDTDGRVLKTVETEGRMRKFTEQRMIPLYVCGWRLRLGDTPKAAGRYALSIYPLVEALYSTSAYWRRSISPTQRKSNLLIVIGERGSIECGFACDRDKFDLGDEQIIEYREISLSAIQKIVRDGIAAEDKRQAEASGVPSLNLHKARS